MTREEREKEKNLFLQFQNDWNLERVKKMTLEEYTGIMSEGERNDFTYILEYGNLKEWGSIKGGVGGLANLKFWICRCDGKKYNIKQEVSYSNDKQYAWLKKYHSKDDNPNNAFKEIRNKIIKIIQASQSNDLDKIENIDLEGMCKWKIAFHYQNPNDMKMFCIFNQKILRHIAKNELDNESLPISQIYMQLMKDKTYTLEDSVNEFSKPLWDKYKKAINRSQTINFKEKNAASNVESKIPLNQILYGPAGTGKTYSTIDKALEILKSFDCIDEIPESREEKREIFNAYKEKGQIEFITFHQSFSYEEFVEGIKPETSENNDNVLYKIKNGIFKKICKKALQNLEKPYILIIDEINRGNISKILGELITLIEESKRIGKDEELKVRLPYSKKEFGVPSNLYIIGTMNTADRSIALLDTALRRRFEFVEMMPKTKLLKDIWLVRDINKAEETSLDEWNTDNAKILFNILTAINNRIEFLLDREHTIGHSFFFEKAKFVESGVWYELSLAGLKEIFAKKIIPLLQEYFYEDYAKIDAVLNGNKMVKSYSMKDLGVKFSDELVDEDKKIYHISNSSEWNEDTFKKIYLKDSNKPDENGE